MWSDLEASIAFDAAWEEDNHLTQDNEPQEPEQYPEQAPTCVICGQQIAAGHICTDCDRELREDAERDAATDKSDWPL